MVTVVEGESGEGIQPRQHTIIRQIWKFGIVRNKMNEEEEKYIITNQIIRAYNIFMQNPTLNQVSWRLLKRAM